jgi:hypothetical protein
VFVENFMPQLPGEKVDNAIQKIVDALATSRAFSPKASEAK